MADEDFWGVEDPFADQRFDQWSALEEACRLLGHTTQTFQGLQAWLLSLRSGTDSRTTAATADRYRTILAAVVKLYGPPCFIYEMDAAEMDEEVDRLAALLAQQPDLSADIIADVLHWWRCKLFRQAHHLGSARTNSVTRVTRSLDLPTPDQRRIAYPEWGPAADFVPVREVLGGDVHYRVKLGHLR